MPQEVKVYSGRLREALGVMLVLKIRKDSFAKIELGPFLVVYNCYKHSRFFFFSIFFLNTCLGR